MLHNLTQNGKNKSSTNPFDHIWERMHLPNFHCKSATWCMYKKFYSRHNKSHIMLIRTIRGLSFYYEITSGRPNIKEEAVENTKKLFFKNSLKKCSLIFHRLTFEASHALYIPLNLHFHFLWLLSSLTRFTFFSSQYFLFHFQNSDQGQKFKRWIFWCRI